jgi:hypothetical protein
MPIDSQAGSRPGVPDESGGRLSVRPGSSGGAVAAVPRQIPGYRRGLGVLVWALAFLVMVEVLLELRAYSRGYDSILFARREPASADSPATAAAATDPEFGPTESFPFRSRVVSVERPADTKRVWISSSSLSEALNLPPDRIFAEYLTQQLNESGLPSQTLNAGRSGMTLAASAARLRNEGPQWVPDYVIVYDMLNDINQLSNAYLAALSRGIPVPDPGAGTGDVPQGSPLVRQLQAATTFAQLREQVTSRVGAQRILFDDLPEAALESFMRDLDEVCQAAITVGARPIVCTFATQLVPGNIKNTPADIWLPMFRYNMYLSLPGWSSVIAELNGRIQAYAAANDYVLADVAAVAAARPEFFTDVAHFSEEGHRLVAPVFAAAVRAADVPGAVQAVVLP